MKKVPLVVIVGRANSGKSTLFNRIIKKPLAVVDERPGVTRDRLKKRVIHDGFPFYIMDTGGLYPPHEDLLFSEVEKNIEKAVDEGDLIIFLVDLKAGLTPFDRDVADFLRKRGKEVLLVANKADIKRKDPYEFLELGFGFPVLVSAAHGMGIEKLLDNIVDELKRLGFEPVEFHEGEKVRVAIVGKPNVGKSSILNALVGEEVAITSEIPGTTRDALDIETDEFLFIDTAGIKKRYKDELEYYAALRSERSIRYAEVAIVVLDVTQEIAKIDKKIIGLVEEEGKPMVIALNKADLLSRERRKELFPLITKELGFVYYVPKLFTSAITGEGLDYLKELLKKVKAESLKRIEKEELMNFLTLAVKHKPPYEIYRVEQVGVSPPTFLLRVERELDASYIRYLERELRMKFGFLGTPLKFLQKEGKMKRR